MNILLFVIYNLVILSGIYAILINPAISNWFICIGIIFMATGTNKE